MPRHKARRPAAIALAVLAIAALLAAGHGHAAADTWRGLAVAPEHRCASYDRADYPYPQSVEREIVASMGGRVYGPYTGRHYRSMRDTDIEHIVAVSEAQDYDSHCTSLLRSGAGVKIGFRCESHRPGCFVGRGSGISNKYSGLSL